MVETIDAGAHRYVGTAFAAVDSGAIRVHRERCAKVRNRNVDCLKCAAACTSGCISLEDGELVIDASKCVGCGTCATVCPTGSRKLFALPEEERFHMPEDMVDDYYLKALERAKRGYINDFDPAKLQS